jgi:hypothetical protein
VSIHHDEFRPHDTLDPQLPADQVRLDEHRRSIARPPTPVPRRSLRLVAPRVEFASRRSHRLVAHAMSLSSRRYSLLRCPTESSRRVHARLPRLPVGCVCRSALSPAACDDRRVCRVHVPRRLVAQMTSLSCARPIARLPEREPVRHRVKLARFPSRAFAFASSVSRSSRSTPRRSVSQKSRRASSHVRSKLRRSGCPKRRRPLRFMGYSSSRDRSSRPVSRTR